jgi:hypothetical protein
VRRENRRGEQLDERRVPLGTQHRANCIFDQCNANIAAPCSNRIAALALIEPTAADVEPRRRIGRRQKKLLLLLLALLALLLVVVVVVV